MVGSFPLLMTLVLILTVWAERILAKPEELAVIDDPFDSAEGLSPKAGMAMPAARGAFVAKPDT